MVSWGQRLSTVLWYEPRTLRSPARCHDPVFKVKITSDESSPPETSSAKANVKEQNKRQRTWKNQNILNVLQRQMKTFSIFLTLMLTASAKIEDNMDFGKEHQVLSS